jgi:succinate-acetate transporter protein
MFLIPSLGIEAAYKGDTRAYSFAIGIYLILWCFVTLIFLIGALRTNVAIVATFFFLTLAFFFLSLAQFLETENAKQSVRLNKTGGAFAIICAATAFWAGIYGLYSKDKTFVTVEVFGLYKHQKHDVEDGHGAGQVNGGDQRAKLPAWKRVTKMGRH